MSTLIVLVVLTLFSYLVGPLDWSSLLFSVLGWFAGWLFVEYFRIGK